MKQTTNRSRIKAYFFPIFFTFLLFGLLFGENLQIETSLPSKDWSRSIKLPVTTTDSQFIIKHTDKGKELYSKTKDGIEKYSIDTSMSLDKEETFPVKPATTFWTDGTNFLYLNSQQQIVHFDGSTEKILAEGADGFTSNEQTAVYWSKNIVYSIDPESFTISEAAKPENEIYQVIVSSNSASFVTLLRGENALLAKWYRQGSSEPIDLASLDHSALERVREFRFMEKDNRLSILYTSMSSKGGSKMMRPLYIEVAIEELPIKESFESIDLINRQSGMKLENPQYITIIPIDDKPAILFSASAQIKPATRSLSIFFAKKQDGKWLADRISTTLSPSVQPVLGGDGMIFWSDNLLNDSYQLYGASTDRNIISTSEKWNKTDAQNAFYASMLAVTNGLFILFSALLWLLPVALFVTIVSLTNIAALEAKKPWAINTALLLFTVSETSLFQMPLKGAFYSHAPEYLTFTGSVIVYPIVISILAWALTKFVSSENWSFFQEILYFISINLLIVILLFGPYIL